MATRGGKAVCAALLACLIVLLVFAAWACLGRVRPACDGFFTRYSHEEPTRAYTPYTGTVPFGPWGTLPWAEMRPVPP
jgi:hypothetical protein